MQPAVVITNNASTVVVEEKIKKSQHEAIVNDLNIHINRLKKSLEESRNKVGDLSIENESLKKQIEKNSRKDFFLQNLQQELDEKNKKIQNLTREIDILKISTSSTENTSSLETTAKNDKKNDSFSNSFDNNNTSLSTTTPTTTAIVVEKLKADHELEMSRLRIDNNTKEEKRLRVEAALHQMKERNRKFFEENKTLKLEVKNLLEKLEVAKVETEYFKKNVDLTIQQQFQQLLQQQQQQQRAKSTSPSTIVTAATGLSSTTKSMLNPISVPTAKPIPNNIAIVKKNNSISNNSNNNSSAAFDNVSVASFASSSHQKPLQQQLQLLRNNNSNNNSNSRLLLNDDETSVTIEKRRIAPKKNPDQEALDLALLLSQQESEYGINMFDSLTPSDDALIEDYKKQG
jgi:hypothetical protein